MPDADAGRDQGFCWKYYWNIDIPGLTEEQARFLVSFSDDRYGTRGSVIDPKRWLTLHLDRATAEVLRDALLSVASNEVGVGMREIVEEWFDSVDQLGASE